MNNDKKRAWRDARQDYLIEQARRRQLKALIIWLFIIMGGTAHVASLFRVHLPRDSDPGGDLVK